MYVSLNWLKEFVEIPVSPEQLADDLTSLGLEIESVERQGQDIEGVVVGEILSLEPHPDADKLVVCKTDTGEATPLQIVCGAKNMKPGDRVPTAIVGACLPGGFKITGRKMRGVESQGMMCSATELGMGEDHAGLLILPPETPIGGDIKAVLGLDDVIYEIEVTPNRADWAGMIGVARELAALYGKELKLPNASVRETGEAVEKLATVKIQNPERCARYVGRVITSVKVGPSPQWLVSRLSAAGQRSINNIVDVTNYVLLETGQPLHAFDYDKLAGHSIIVRTAKAGESIRCIDGELRALDLEMLVIADDSQPVAIAGVMGGFESEVTEATTRVLLESAWFNPVLVRKTARKLNLVTEASQRFQRGADPDMAPYAMDRMAKLILETAGGTAAAGAIDAYPNPIAPKEVTLRFAATDRLLGEAIPPDEQVRFLERLGLMAGKATAEACTFRAPLRRNDITLEQDLIEEIGRLHGYNNIPDAYPRVRQSGQVFAPQEARIAKLRNRLLGMGLNEVINMSFSSQDAMAKCNMGEGYDGMVTLMNPLSSAQGAMRRSLVPGLLETASLNLRRGAQRVRAFEIGPVYAPASGDHPAVQAGMLSVVLAGQRLAKEWPDAETPYELADLKGIADSLIEGRPGITIEPDEYPLFTPGRSARFLCDGKAVGCLGEISPRVRKNLDLATAVYLLEIELDPLAGEERLHTQFTSPSSQPASLRDLAVVVDSSVAAGSLLATAKEKGGKNLVDTVIIDVYTGEPIAKGKKSVAISLTFQSQDSTLTDTQIDKTVAKILQALEQQHGAALR